MAEGVAGPYAGKLLGLMGADVVKIEPPAGDATRHEGPVIGVEGPEHERRALFLHLNRAKRSLAVDPGAAGDRQLVSRLLERSDIAVCGRNSPGQGPAFFGVDLAQIRQVNPRLTVVDISPFGTTGPYASYLGGDLTAYAFGGAMSSTGLARREPVKLGGHVGMYQAGTMAALAALAGLAVSDQSGVGPQVDLALVEAHLVSIDRRMSFMLYQAYTGRDAPRSQGRQIGIYPSGVRLAGDGNLWVSTMPQWVPRMLRALGDEDLSERYGANPSILDRQLAELVDVAVTTWGVSRTRQEAMEQAQAVGWAVTALNSPTDVLSDPHFQARGFFESLDHPVAGGARYAGAPIRFPGAGSAPRAPLLDEHRAELGRELSAEAPSTSGPRPPRVAGSGALPLAGLRVLDMTVVWAGPFATTLLADLGAEVIRVDNPWVWPASTRGLMPRPPAELVARLGPIFGGYPQMDPGRRPWNRVALFTAHARGKKSVTLGVHKPLGREMFLRLAEKCDVLIENNSVDLMDRLEIGWKAVSARNPRLIMLRMPSVGLEGPYRGYVGFGINFESLCGLTFIRGYGDEDLADTDSVFHMDAATGSAGALAVLAALRQRQRSGEGTLIELSQSENMLNHIGELLVAASVGNAVTERSGNRDPDRAPQGVYRCRDAEPAVAEAAGVGLPAAHGADRWAAISVETDQQWEGLRRAMGDPAWAAEPDLGTLEGRRRNHDQLDGRIEAWTRRLDQYEVFHRCQAQGVPAAPVLTESACYSDPHLRQRGLFRANGSPELGEHEYVAHPFRWDGPPLRWGAIPTLGQHNEEVFRGLLGLTDQEYGRLSDDGHLSQDYLGPDGSPL